MSRENLLTEEIFPGFTQRLKTARKKMDLDLDEFGRKLGVSGPTVSRYESGDIQLPKKRLRQYVDITGRTQDWFLYGDRLQMKESPSPADQPPAPEQPPARPPQIDKDLLRSIIVLVEECLEEKKSQVKAVQKANVIILLYEQHRQHDVPVTRDTVLSFIDAFG